MFEQQFGLAQDTIKLLLIGDSAGANLALATYQNHLTIKERQLGQQLQVGEQQRLLNHRLQRES